MTKFVCEGFHQISLLILSEFKRINELLFDPEDIGKRFPDDLRGKRS